MIFYDSFSWSKIPPFMTSRAHILGLQVYIKTWSFDHIQAFSWPKIPPFMTSRAHILIGLQVYIKTWSFDHSQAFSPQWVKTSPWGKQKLEVFIQKLWFYYVSGYRLRTIAFREYVKMGTVSHIHSPIQASQLCTLLEP